MTEKKTSVTWIVLTYNRAETVKTAIASCMANAGTHWDEMIWVDNGSSDDMSFMHDMKPDVKVLNKRNLGVARGYNIGLGLASRDYIVITGCDMIMPDGWLALFKEYIAAAPQSIFSIYSKPLDYCRERLLGAPQLIGSLPVIPAMALERRIFKRSLLGSIGYFPESFGLYGFDDLAWAERAHRHTTTYVIPTVHAIHLGTEGIYAQNEKELPEYHAFKHKEATDPAKQLELERLRRLGWPKYSPYL